MGHKLHILVHASNIELFCANTYNTTKHISVYLSSMHRSYLHPYHYLVFKIYLFIVVKQLQSYNRRAWHTQILIKLEKKRIFLFAINVISCQ